MYFESFIIYRFILYIMENTKDNSNKPQSTESTTKSKILNRYFIPPQTAQYMKWGQAFMIFIIFLLMFIGILFAYIYANFTDYQNRIAVVANASLFGEDPEGRFKRYMKNSQNELISSVMKDIQSSGTNLETINARLDKSASRLANQVEVDVPEQYTETNSLGMSIQKNIASLRDTISKLAGSFVLSNYVKDGVLNTVKTD